MSSDPHDASRYTAPPPRSPREPQLGAHPPRAHSEASAARPGAGLHPDPDGLGSDGRRLPARLIRRLIATGCVLICFV